MNSIEQQFPNVRGQGDYLRRSLEEARSLRERDLTHTGESLERLTQRQREILLKVVDGAPTKPSRRT
jgi:FixJ family two-component response regulator